MTLPEAVALIDNTVPEPERGLPEELFLLASRVTPMVNVDLLVRDVAGRILLAWRDDGIFGPGWHVPGGIVRFKERLEVRLEAVARLELGAHVDYDPVPLEINQMIQPVRRVRGHFISFLYRCSVAADYVPDNQRHGPRQAGYLMWHSRCPADLLEVHGVYRKYFNE